VPDRSRHFASIVLAAGAVVLLAAIAVGHSMGDRVLGQATERSLPPMLVVGTPEPYATAGPFGPDWKESEALSAPPDPRFPDPRVPPVPLPTLRPATPAPSPSPVTPTPNPNIPIWRQQPLPTPTPEPTGPDAGLSPASPSPGAPLAQGASPPP
jgi:hypothetical protein